MPCVTLSVTCSIPALASTSNTRTRLPFATENTSGVLAFVVCAAGTLFTGASLTAAMLIVELVVAVSATAAGVAVVVDEQGKRVGGQRSVGVVDVGEGTRAGQQVVQLRNRAVDE